MAGWDAGRTILTHPPAHRLQALCRSADMSRMDSLRTRIPENEALRGADGAGNVADSEAEGSPARYCVRYGIMLHILRTWSDMYLLYPAEAAQISRQ